MLATRSGVIVHGRAFWQRQHGDDGGLAGVGLIDDSDRCWCYPSCGFRRRYWQRFGRRIPVAEHLGGKRETGIRFESSGQHQHGLVRPVVALMQRAQLAGGDALHGGRGTETRMAVRRAAVNDARGHQRRDIGRIAEAQAQAVDRLGAIAFHLILRERPDDGRHRPADRAQRPASVWSR